MAVSVGTGRATGSSGVWDAPTASAPPAAAPGSSASGSPPLAAAVAPAAPVSSFVAVGTAGSESEADLPPGAGIEPTRADARWHARSVATLPGTARLLAAAACGATLALAGCDGWLAGDLTAAGWAVVALVGASLAGAFLAALAGATSLAAASAPWRRMGGGHSRAARLAASTPSPPPSAGTSSRSASRPGTIVATAAVTVPLALIAAVPWLARPAGWPGETTLIAGLVVALALLATALLAPIRALAIGAAALPLSPALHAWHVDPAGLDPAGALACLLASGALLLLAIALHRRWRYAALAVIDLEDRVAALEAARDAAIRADQEKSRFLAIASHDLRQPVHAIGLFAATLEKRLAGSAEEPLVRNLNRAIDGLDRSFNVMLDISRLDAGAVEPRVRQFPLRDLFRRLHMHFAGQAEQLGLTLRFSPGGKSVSSDPQLLERVLGNLVQNAIKYTQRGGIVVVARSTATHTHVEIWDTGVGIRGADLPKVFDEFYQVGRGERLRAQGLGMGLAIVKRLVRLMGHQLTVSSRPGRGTMFRLAIARGGLPDIQEVTAAADTLPMPVLQARTVLVLDDEEPIREGLCLLLQEWGYDAVAAGSIAEAEAAVDRLDAPPDLMLSDLHLGDSADGRDGIHAIELIRRRCGGNLAAMLITGDTSHTEIRRATESGHPVLFKPVQPRKLYDALRGLGS